MDIKDIIANKTCYIVSNELKQEILSYMHNYKLLLDVHFFSLHEFISKFYFTYDIKAIYMVAKNFNLSYSNAQIMINNLYYLMYTKETDNEKVKYLKTIKQYLDNNNLLKYDINFFDWIKQYNIVTDLSLSNPFLYKINELLSYQIQQLDNKTKDSITVLHFDNAQEEIEYLANEIADLLHNGVDANKIHILNANDDYKIYIDKIFTLYNIPFSIKTNNCLYNLPYIKQLYANRDYQSNNITVNNINLYNQLKESISYIKDEDEKQTFLLYLLKSTSSKEDTFTNIIQFSSEEALYIKDHYYFFIGLNNKVFPNYKKDEEYLSDKEKINLGYIDSIKCNELKREYYKKRLKSPNVFLSYKDSDYFNSFLKSDIISEIDAKIIEKTNKNSYSYEYDLLSLTSGLDDYYKFNIVSDKLEQLLTKISKENYSIYSNKYTQVDTKLYLNNVLDNKINISYSSFEKFNQCKYKYYLDTVLKQKEDSFNTYIGTMFHYVLESIYNPNFDFDKTINSFESDYVLSNKEEILLKNLLEDFKKKIQIILEQYNKGHFKRIEKEKKISIRVKHQLSVEIKGFIDKIMLDDNNNAYIVDYKTGDNKLSLDYLDYGLQCQLPFYFYLLNKSKEYANIFLVGCYLQIINFKFKTPDNNSKELLLEGLTYNDASIVEKIDNFYTEESFIKGIKPNKKGLGTYARTFDKKLFEEIILKMEENINKMIDDIINANFTINPKILKNKETTCKFCSYKDICYHNYSDYIDIRKVKENEVD